MEGFISIQKFLNCLYFSSKIDKIFCFITCISLENTCKGNKFKQIVSNKIKYFKLSDMYSLYNLIRPLKPFLII